MDINLMSDEAIREAFNESDKPSEQRRILLELLLEIRRAVAGPVIIIENRRASDACPHGQPLGGRCSVCDTTDVGVKEEGR